jgi:DNA invertase Pin-like site-specific DNA recombinase
MLIGYQRSSTVEQKAGFEEQERLLVATGCTKIFAEMVSSLSERAQLLSALEWVREGDTLVVTQLDRLARSTSDLLSIIDRLEKKGVGLRVLNFGGTVVDTQSATGKMLITMFGAIAEWELATMRSRQKIGIAKAKAEGRYKGRAPTARAKVPQMLELEQAGLGAHAIATRLGVARSSVYRLLSEERPSS